MKWQQEKQKNNRKKKRSNPSKESKPELFPNYKFLLRIHLLASAHFLLTKKQQTHCSLAYVYYRFLRTLHLLLLSNQSYQNNLDRKSVVYGKRQEVGDS